MSNDTLVAGITNISNFRDAGIGKNMKRKNLFRCATMDRASSADLRRIVKDLSVKSIIDLRGPKENLKRTEHAEHICDFYHIVDCKDGEADLIVKTLQDDSKARNIFKINLAHIIRVAVWESTSWFVKLYFVFLSMFGWGLYAQRYIVTTSFLGKEGLYGLNKAFLKYGRVYMRQFLAVAADRESFPLIIHCSAGKDRTGLTIALLQKICGVDDEEIVAEYAKSAALLDQELLAKNVGKLGLSKDFSESRPETMEKTLLHIEQEYGSVKKYLVSYVGVTEELIEKIRSNLTKFL